MSGLIRRTPADTWSISSHCPADRASQRSPPPLVLWYRADGATHGTWSGNSHQTGWSHKLQLRGHHQSQMAFPSCCHGAKVNQEDMCLHKKTRSMHPSPDEYFIFQRPIRSFCWLSWWSSLCAKGVKAAACFWRTPNMEYKWHLSSGACTLMLLAHTQTIPGGNVRQWYEQWEKTTLEWGTPCTTVFH